MANTDFKIIRKKRKKLKRLWKDFYVSRNKLFDYYWKWARSVARIYSKKFRIEYSNVESEAALGLLKAINNERIVTVSSDNEFKRYAMEAMRTTIIDGIKEIRGVARGKINITDISLITRKPNDARRMKRVKEEVEAIKEFVEKLEPFEKNLIYRRYFLGEKLAVISKDFGMSEPMLSSKCREIVRNMVEDTGVGPVT